MGQLPGYVWPQTSFFAYGIYYENTSNATYPAHDGFIKLEDQAFTASPQTPTFDQASPMRTHQLHCLKELQLEFTALVHSLHTLTPYGGTSPQAACVSSTPCLPDTIHSLPASCPASCPASINSSIVLVCASKPVLSSGRLGLKAIVASSSYSERPEHDGVAEPRPRSLILLMVHFML